MSRGRQLGQGRTSRWMAAGGQQQRDGVRHRCAQHEADRQDRQLERRRSGSQSIPEVQPHSNRGSGGG